MVYEAHGIMFVKMKTIQALWRICLAFPAFMPDIHSDHKNTIMAYRSMMYVSLLKTRPPGAHIEQETWSMGFGGEQGPG